METATAKIEVVTMPNGVSNGYMNVPIIQPFQLQPSAQTIIVQQQATLPLVPQQPASEDEIRLELLKTLEYYFSSKNLSKDEYLISQMDHEYYVRLDEIAKFRKIKQLTSDIELIKSIIRQSTQLQLDPYTNTKVRSINGIAGGIITVNMNKQSSILNNSNSSTSNANMNSNNNKMLSTSDPLSQQCIIILREVSHEATVDKVRELFENKEQQQCPPCVKCEAAGNDSYYVTFSNEEQAQRALQYLKVDVQSFLNKPIRARLKHHVSAPRLNNLSNSDTPSSTPPPQPLQASQIMSNQQQQQQQQQHLQSPPTTLVAVAHGTQAQIVQPISSLTQLAPSGGIPVAPTHVAGQPVISQQPAQIVHSGAPINSSSYQVFQANNLDPNNLFHFNQWNPNMHQYYFNRPTAILSPANTHDNLQVVSNSSTEQSTSSPSTNAKTSNKLKNNNELSSSSSLSSNQTEESHSIQINLAPTGTGAASATTTALLPPGSHYTAVPVHFLNTSGAPIPVTLPVQVNNANVDANPNYMKAYVHPNQAHNNHSIHPNDQFALNPHHHHHHQISHHQIHAHPSHHQHQSHHQLHHAHHNNHYVETLNPQLGTVNFVNSAAANGPIANHSSTHPANNNTNNNTNPSTISNNQYTSFIPLNPYYTALAAAAYQTAIFNNNNNNSNNNSSNSNNPTVVPSSSSTTNSTGSLNNDTINEASNASEPTNTKAKSNSNNNNNSINNSNSSPNQQQTTTITAVQSATTQSKQMSQQAPQMFIYNHQGMHHPHHAHAHQNNLMINPHLIANSTLHSTQVSGSSSAANSPHNPATNHSHTASNQNHPSHHNHHHHNTNNHHHHHHHQYKPNQPNSNNNGNQTNAHSNNQQNNTNNSSTNSHHSNHNRNYNSTRRSYGGAINNNNNNNSNTGASTTSYPRNSYSSRSKYQNSNNSTHHHHHHSNHHPHSNHTSNSYSKNANNTNSLMRNSDNSNTSSGISSTSNTPINEKSQTPPPKPPDLISFPPLSVPVNNNNNNNSTNLDANPIDPAIISISKSANSIPESPTIIKNAQQTMKKIKLLQIIVKITL